jgi:hypothetical protein
MFKRIFTKKQEKKEEDFFDNCPDNIIDDIEFENESILSEDETLHNEEFSIDPELSSIKSNSSMIPNYDNDKGSIYSDSIYSNSTYHSSTDDFDEQYLETLELLLNCYDY